MTELDALIKLAPVVAMQDCGYLAWQLQQFIRVAAKGQLSAFELLAFYHNLDTNHNLPGCLYNQLFQKNAITAPLALTFIWLVDPGCGVDR